MATKIILTHMHTHLTQTQTQGLYARDTDLCHQLLGIKAKKNLYILKTERNTAEGN